MIRSVVESRLRQAFPGETAVGLAALDFATVMLRAVDMIAKSDSPMDPNVWIAALEEAPREFASERLAVEWLAAGNVLVDRLQGK